MDRQVPEFNVTRMTLNQIYCLNRMIVEEALDRKKKQFMGACRKHGYTLLRIEMNGGVPRYRCLSCYAEKEAKRAARRIKDADDYARKLRNRKSLHAALRAGLATVELECVHHGLTLFTIRPNSKHTYCRICHRERIYRGREKQRRLRELKDDLPNSNSNTGTSVSVK